MFYRTVVVDSPWNESGGGKSKRGADKHYPLIKKKEDIRDTLLSSGLWEIADDAHGYFWATNNHLPDALWLMQEMGFTYITNVVWVKTVPSKSWGYGRLWKFFMDTVNSLGMDQAVMRWMLKHGGLVQYFAGQHELLLFGRKGKGKHPEVYQKEVELWGRKYTGTVFFAPVGEHSEKPEMAYDLIMARSKGPYLDMFARKERPGWDVWGNEV